MIKNQSNLLNEMLKAFAKDERGLVKNNELDVRKIISLIIADDEKIYKCLLSNKTIKNAIFKNVVDCLVFDKQKMIEMLKTNNQFITSSYTKYANRIGLTNDVGEFIKDSDDVVLSFPYKDCVLEFDSTDPDVERDEIFYNETIAKDKINKLFDNKVFVDTKKVVGEVKEKEVIKGKKKKIERTIKIKESNADKFDINDNLLIKGNNLLAMYSLLPRYEGQIKLMYWDILYNTENDHVPYNDSFKHSSWLTMMKNRLEVGKKLLSDNGIICIQCDDNEMHYLKVLCDEVFKRENFISLITCKVTSPGGLTGSTEPFFNCAEYILVYSKSSNYDYNDLMNEVGVINKDSKVASSYKYKFSKLKIEEKKYVGEYKNIKFFRLDKKHYSVQTINTSCMSEKDYYDKRDELFETTALSGGIGKKLKEAINEFKLQDDFIIYEYTPTKGRDKGKHSSYFLLNNRKVSYLKNYIKVDVDNKTIIKLENCTNILDDNWWNGISKEGGKGIKLNNGKKPEILLKTLIYVFTNKNDIVLDAYFGTGTTGAVAMKMGRRFIGIEQLDEHIKLSKQRLTNVINGDTTGISEQVGWSGGGNFTYVKMAENNKKFVNKIEKAKSDKELKKIFEDMIATAYISLDVDLTKLDVNDKDFNELSFKEKKKVLKALLGKNHLYVNVCDMNDKEFKIKENYKKWTKSFYEM